MRKPNALWLAGLLEGEGCFFAEHHPTKRPKLRVTVGSTDKDVIEMAAKIHQSTGKILTKVPKEKELGKKPSYRITWYGKQAETLIERVYPYLGKRRKDKALTIMELELSHQPKGSR